MNKTGAVGLAIALGGAPLFVVVSEWLFGESPTMAVQVALQFLYCGMACFLLWFVLRVERLPLASIGLKRPTWLTVVSGLGLLAVSLYVLAPLMAPLQRLLGTEGMQAGIDQLATLPSWFRVVVGLTAGMIVTVLGFGPA